MDFENFVQEILRNAENNTLQNGVCKQITYCQAVSIALRSDQLASESVSRPTNEKSIQWQVDICYRQRQEQPNE